MSTDILTIQEAAATLRMTVRTLRRLARRGEVPHILLPDREFRFVEEELEEWVQLHRQGPDQKENAGGQPGVSCVQEPPVMEGRHAESF